MQPKLSFNPFLAVSAPHHSSVVVVWAGNSPKRNENHKITVLKAVILNNGNFYPPGDIWQCLQTFFLLELGGKSVTQCHSLVFNGWSPRILGNILQWPGTLPITPVTRPQFVKIVFRLKNLILKPRRKNANCI